MKRFVTLFFLLIAFNVSALNAKVLKIAVITSEFDQDVTDYFIETDEHNEIESMRYVTVMPNGGILTDTTLSVETVMDEGAVIVERNGHQAVILQVENFSPKRGGVVKLNYLYNGITGTRHIKRFNLVLINNVFRLTDSEGHNVNRMFLEANMTRWFGIIGIKNIVTSYVESL